MTVTVERVSAAVTAPLRQQVLRPHQTPDQLLLPDDDAADTGHYAAVADGEVVGTGSVRREAPPWAPESVTSWRLRGMATAEEWRSRGVGAGVLAAAVSHVRRHGGGLLWCHARTPAMQFYLRNGFTTRGEVWLDRAIGPHITMQQTIEPPGGDSACWADRVCDGCGAIIDPDHDAGHRCQDRPTKAPGDLAEQ